jgi:nucleoside-diphosphate-sugar epimerase
MIREIAGGKGRIIALPKAVVKAAAYAQEISHYLAGSSVRFPVKSVDHLFSHYTFSSQKAAERLGYRITPLEEALQKTIQFLKHTHG